MKKIVVFGSSGNTGQYFVDFFKQSNNKDYELIGADISNNEYVDTQVPFIQMDINDEASFSLLPVENVYSVIDLIGPMPARMKGYHPEEYVHTNIVGTFNILRYCVRVQADRFIYARSFCDILKNSETDPVLKTDTPAYFDYGDDHAVYSVSQISAVELIKCFHAYYGLKTFVFRLPTIYLWSKNDSYSVKGIPQKKMYRHMIDLAIEGKPIEVWGDPNREKDMLYVKDLCQMLFKACFVDREGGFYNAGTGKGTSLIDQIRGIIDIFGGDQKIKLVYRPDKQNAPQYIMDIGNLKKDLNYEPQYSYTDMLKDMKKEREIGRF